MLPDWLEDLRRVVVVKPVLQRSPTSEQPLGFDREYAMREVLGWGQADFDEPCQGLSEDDRVLLYAFYFQVGHLEELVAEFGLLFDASGHPKDPIVVDIGCGPGTGCLAIAASQFPQDSRIDYIGIDRSIAMCFLGERFAAAVSEKAGMVRTLPQIHCRWALDVPSVSWDEASSQRPVIVIVSYLLASPTLDVAELVPALDRLLAKLGSGSVTVLYTNSIHPGPNRKLSAFSKMLCARGFSKHADGPRRITARKNRGFREFREFRYALFERPAQ